MICPRCGSRMIERYKPSMKLVYPPIDFSYYWCACGHQEDIGQHRGMTEEENALRQWRDLNEERTRV